MKYLTALLSLFLLACEPYEPPNPNGPNGSWWAGGNDGGAYIFIEDNSNPADNIYQGAIYFDADKSVWYQGRFKYSQDKPFDFKNKDLYSGWDGERVLLKNNEHLLAIDPIPPL